ncbi:hypothetical protein [Vulcanisaeta sp. JCM 16159]|uniref:hypothetical protein n=1 Tax=Vulcanisaeta sp. JCM 16159 TaxID=1295371 RepID=UPI000B326406|nr:hypothetical protein [Vulcanisaeta sp. JCM 16159]
MVSRGVIRVLVIAMLVLSLAALIVHAQATDQAQVEAARALAAGIGFGLAALVPALVLASLALPR